MVPGTPMAPTTSPYGYLIEIAPGLLLDPFSGEVNPISTEGVMSLTRMQNPWLTEDELRRASLLRSGLAPGAAQPPSVLDWSQFSANEAWRRIQTGQAQAQMAQQQAQFQAQLQQAAELAALARAQQQRQMAAQIGQTIAQLQSQQWQTGLPWDLPRGTHYLPGMAPGGPAARVAAVSQTQFRPMYAQRSLGPSRKEMEKWLSSAIARFG